MRKNSQEIGSNCGRPA